MNETRDKDGLVQQLRESEERYRAVVSQAMEGIFLFDLETQQILEANTAFQNLLGYTSQEITQLTLYDFVAHTREDIDQHLQQLVTQKQHHIATRRYRRKEGSLLDVEVQSSVIRFSEREVGCAVIRDITERQHAEQALRESEKRYHALYEDNPSMYFTVDTQGVVLSVNRFGAEQLGYAAEELIGQSVLKVFDPDDKAAVQQQLAACLQHLDQVAHWEFRKVRKDGSMLWVKESARTVHQVDGQPMVLIVCEDITEHKQAEQQLRWRTEDLALINTINEAINHGASLTQVTQLLAQETRRIFSSNGTHLYLLDPNKQWLSMLGLSLPPQVTQQIERLIGMPIPPISLPIQALTLYRQVMEQKQSLCSNDPKVIQGLVSEYATGIPLSDSVRTLLSRLVGAIYATLGIRGIIVVPLLAENEPIGILDMSRGSPFAEDDLRRMETIAAQLTRAISHKRTEEALRDSEDRYRDLVESSPVIIILHDLQGQVISANPAAAQLLGYTTGEIARMNIRDSLARQARDQLGTYLATVQQNGYASGLMRVQTRSGETRILEFTSTLRTEGVATPIVRAMARDVTELKRAERAQARLARQMSALYETSLEINSQTDLPQLLATIIQRSADLLGARIGVLYLMQPDNATLKLIASHNLPGDYIGVTLRLGEGLAGRVAQTGNPLMIEDHSQWEDRAEVFADSPFRRMLGVPLKSGQRVIGVLNFSDVDKTGAYQEDDIRLACLFADQAAIAIENARLFAEAKQRAKEFAALYETTRDLATQWHLPTLLETIALRAIKLLDASGGSVLLHDQLRNDLELAVAKGNPTSASKHFNLTEEIARHVARTRQPVIVNDYSTWEHRSPEYEDVPFPAILQVPMLYGGELIGILSVSEINRATHRFTDDDARLMSLFAAQSASAVYNARLLQQTRQRAEQLALLYDAALTLNRAIEPRQIIEHLLAITHQSVHAARADFYRYDPIQRSLVFENSSGYAPDLASTLHTLRFTEGEVRGLVGLVAQERTPLYLPDTTADPRWIPVDSTIRSALWVPVEREQQLYGVLTVSSPDPDAFTPADQRLVTLFANQVAVALERAHLFQAEQNRRAELAALYDLSRALSDTDALDAILDLVVQSAVETIQITFARVALIEGGTLVVQATQQIRNLDRVLSIESRAALTDLPICQRALEQNEITLLHTTPSDVGVTEREFLLLDPAKTLCLVPLRAGGHALGLLMLGEARDPEREPFTAEQMRLARSIGDQAASAIRRTKLREQIERRLSQVQALHTIDMTITGSLDLNVTLDVLLTQVVAQLSADAADILRFKPHSQMLEHLAGHGFHSKAIESSQLRLGVEYAGRAALEQRIVSELNLLAPRETLLRSFLYTDEGFASCVCVPLIAKGQIKGVLEIFFRAPFSPDSDWLELVETLGTQAAIAMDNADLFDNLQRSNLELALAYDATIAGWSRTLELRDPAHAGRTQRVTELTIRLARALGIREPELIHLRHGALLHDVGMLSIPDAIWRKRGTLTPKEKQIVRQHPHHASQILSSSAYLRPILDIPYCHHERWNGRGYPRRLAGGQIPLAARIFAVADAWDTLTVGASDQPAQTREQARAYLRKMAGKIFDPRVVQTFLSLMEENDAENRTG